MEQTIKPKSKLSAELLQVIKRMGIMRYPRMHRGRRTYFHFRAKGV